MDKLRQGIPRFGGLVERVATRSLKLTGMVEWRCDTE
jgi:hypothetical protein